MKGDTEIDKPSNFDKEKILKLALDMQNEFPEIELAIRQNSGMESFYPEESIS